MVGPARRVVVACWRRPGAFHQRWQATSRQASRRAAAGRRSVATVRAADGSCALAHVVERHYGGLARRKLRLGLLAQEPEQGGFAVARCDVKVDAPFGIVHCAKDRVLLIVTGGGSLHRQPLPPPDHSPGKGEYGSHSRPGRPEGVVWTQQRSTTLKKSAQIAVRQFIPPIGSRVLCYGHAHV